MYGRQVIILGAGGTPSPPPFPLSLHMCVRARILFVSLCVRLRIRAAPVFVLREGNEPDLHAVGTVKIVAMIC